MTFEYEPRDSVPLPPKDARVVTTACEYCAVGCGYKAYTWPMGHDGGLRADDNALGVDFPLPLLSGAWPSPNQHNHCMINGRKHNVMVIADPDATVVNRGGNHSIRGGMLAKKCFNPDGPTRDRLQHPMLRVNGELTPISWDAAIDIMARVSQHVIARHGKPAWGMKTYSYQYFENTYAITKLAFQAIQTPAFAQHDKPANTADTPGIDDAGIITFSACYEDLSQADVIFISGTDPLETKTVVFTDWMMPAGVTMIMVNPRKTAGAAWAEKNGGLFLQIIPGTDAILHMALARIILENNWQDQAFIDRWIANRWEIDSGFGRGSRDTPWQWRTTWGKFGATYEEYRQWVLSNPLAERERAAQITGIPVEQITRAAEMLAAPRNGARPKASFVMEKGNYWSNNQLNTTSYASLALICGTGNRPGQVLSRLGGHQRGWMPAASYPLTLSPEKQAGRRRKALDLDRWVEAGKLRFAWVIGTTWVQAMCASHDLELALRRLTRGSEHQVQHADADHAVDVLKRRADAGGMILIDQDIYPVRPIGTELADLVLPAACWGEHEAARCNGERRLRLYSKFCDPPGEARPDWWIIARFAQRMGFKDFEWTDANDVFEQASRSSRGKVLDYFALVEYARSAGMRGHDLLRELGTRGIQTPVRFRAPGSADESGEYREYAGWYKSKRAPGLIVGTKRLHDPALKLGDPVHATVHAKWLNAFNSQTGKALLQKSPWELFADFYDRIVPGEGEFWVSNGRMNENWQSLFDDLRRPYIMQRWPESWVEIHPDDAARLGIESGDRIAIENDDVLIQTGGFVAVGDEDLSFSALQKAGLIRIGSGRCEGIAIVTDAVQPGLVFTNFNDPRPFASSNALVHRVPDPISNNYRYKLGKGRLRKIGESPYKDDLKKMSFAPRTIM